MQYISVFLDKAKLAVSGEKKYLCKQNSRGVPRDLYVFWIFSW